MQIFFLILASLFYLHELKASSISVDLEAITGIEAASIKEYSIWNPQNSTYQFYQKNVLLDLRPKIEIKPIPWANIFVRPRIEIKHGQNNFENLEQTKFKKDFWINEGYVSLELSSYMQFHLGRQIFLWGPSEIISPSNTLYPDVLNQFNPLYQIHGVTLARANINLHDRFNLIVLSEIKPLEDYEFEMRSENENYKQRFLLKPEFNSISGDINLGLTIGKNTFKNSILSENRNSLLYGSYGMWTINSTAQLYYDLRLDHAESISYPFYVTGLRWTFEDGTEWRNEYIYKKTGNSKNEFSQLNILMQNNDIANTARSFLRNNTDTLMSDEYYYSSLRFTLEDGTYLERPIIGLRSFYSLSSKSGVGSFFFEAGLSDTMTLTCYVAQSYGSSTGELNQLVNSVGGLYLHYNY